jgi:stage III sporulation protein AD
MDYFIKITAATLISLILYLILNKQAKDFSVLLSLCACCMITAASVSFLKPLIDFIGKLESLGNFAPEFIKIMLKSVGVGLLTEIVSLICTDAGNSSLAKSLQILGSAVILYLAMPLFSNLLDIIEDVLSTL